MARQARANQESKFFHIITRGINGEKIFDSEEEKYKIIELYSDELRDWKILSYCIMSNHTHFIVDVENVNILSNNMKSINLTYSNFYNRRHDRKGHLFQNRFKSVPILSYNQLFENLRYIHNNPVMAKMVSNVFDYTFSSYNYFFEKKFSIVDSEFRKLIRDNFVDGKSFLDFHMEPLLKLCLDTDEDILRAKFRIMDNVVEYDIIDQVLSLFDAGLNKAEIAKGLGIDRKKVTRIVEKEKDKS